MSRIASLTLLLLATLIAPNPSARAQQVIDQVVAVVGREKLLLSDVEQELLRMRMFGVNPGINARCEVFENLVVHKLLLDQAMIDSVVVSDVTVDGEVDRRIAYFVAEAGSQEALERRFGKPIFQIREDLREVVRESQLVQETRAQIVGNIRVTPTQVRKFYRSIPPDSIPIIPEQLEYRHIVLYPPAMDEAKLEVRAQLLELRERILRGDRFTTLAVAYSQDRGTAMRGGELGFRFREELVRRFADVAFNLQEGQVSQIVETEYGFHLIQMIERRGNQVNVRHILMRPTYTQDAIDQTFRKLDSIATLIRSDTLTFQEAALRFSQDPATRLSGGLVLNPQTGTSLFEREQVPPADLFHLRSLGINEISRPFESRDQHHNPVFKIATLTQIIPSHRANLELDYALIQEMARRFREQQILMDWIAEKRRTTYIRIHPSFQGCQVLLAGEAK